MVPIIMETILDITESAQSKVLGPSSYRVLQANGMSCLQPPLPTILFTTADIAETPPDLR